MGKIDIAIIIIALLFALIGLKKGFFKQLLSTANWFVSLILAFVLVKPVTNLLSDTNMAMSINTKIADWLATKGAVFTTPYDPSQPDAMSEAITEILSLPKFIADLIVNNLNLDVPSGTTLGDYLTPVFGHIILTVISFAILFLGMFIVIKIIARLLDKLFKGGILGVFNKILGVILGLGKAFILVSVVMLVLSMISPLITSLNDFLISDLKLTEAGFGIGKYFYEENPMKLILKGTIDFDNIFK